MSETKIKDLLKHRDYIRMGSLQVVDVTTEEDNGEMLVEGLAVVFDQPTVLFRYGDRDVKEVIERGALDEADFADCFFKYNHSDHNMAMARVKNGTLSFEIRDEGLYIKARLANTTAGRDLYTLIKRGDIDKMSFAFSIKEEVFDEGEFMFRVKRIAKVWDVSAVNVPAYDGTELYARRLEDVEAFRAKEVEASVERQRQELRAKIEAKAKKLKEKLTN